MSFRGSRGHPTRGVIGNTVRRILRIDRDREARNASYTTLPMPFSIHGPAFQARPMVSRDMRLAFRHLV